VNASIIELAERAELSPPTVTRFCRRLGCESFSYFKVQLARTAHIGVRYLKPESKSTDPADVAQDIISCMLWSELAVMRSPRRKSRFWSSSAIIDE
ncbi:MurR/RpiR family transcriptional regulator, partial [Rhizobium leguminosarum]|uniref:MurR/RpiR family transcriptional regulator n=1 Tax=Rhizobium leguminosarum TaxID=384 RepID=UPI003F94B332